MTEDEFHLRTGGRFKEGYAKYYLMGNQGFYEIDLDTPPFCTMEEASLLINHLSAQGLVDPVQGWRPDVMETLSGLVRK